MKPSAGSLDGKGMNSLKTLSRLALIVLKYREKNLHSTRCQKKKNSSNKLGRVIGFRVD